MKPQKNTSLTDSVIDNSVQQQSPRVKMLLPPPILLLLLGILAACLHWVRWAGFQFSPVRVLIGGVIVLLGGLLICVCGQFFINEKTPIRPDRTHTTAIVMHGPYAYSRNPMYLGMALILLGLSILLKSPFFLFSVFIFIAILHFGVVRPEERYLLQMYPEVYSAYLKKVRRWL